MSDIIKPNTPFADLSPSSWCRIIIPGTMHELTVVLNIIQIAEEQVIKADAASVDSIELDVGVLSCVEIAAMEFAWGAATPGTVLSNAQKIINRIPGKARCQECQHTFPVQTLYDACPDCGAFCFEILEGQELKVKSLVVS